MVSFETRYGLKWSYRFFRGNGNGVIRSLVKAFMLKRGRTIKIYPFSDSVIREIKEKAGG